MLQFHSMIAAMSTARQFFSAAVQISTNNSFKPTPLRGAA
jgi:hypothetical protein